MTRDRALELAEAVLHQERLNPRTVTSAEASEILNHLAVERSNKSALAKFFDGVREYR